MQRLGRESTLALARPVPPKAMGAQAKASDGRVHAT